MYSKYKYHIFNTLMVHSDSARHPQWIRLRKLQPAIFPLFKHVIRFQELPARQCNAPYNRACNVDRSLNGIITSQLVIRESESPRPVDHYPIHNNTLTSEPMLKHT